MNIIPDKMYIKMGLNALSSH